MCVCVRTRVLCVSTCVCMCVCMCSCMYVFLRWLQTQEEVNDRVSQCVWCIIVSAGACMCVCVHVHVCIHQARNRQIWGDCDLWCWLVDADQEVSAGVFPCLCVCVLFGWVLTKNVTRDCDQKGAGLWKQSKSSVCTLCVCA